VTLHLGEIFAVEKDSVEAVWSRIHARLRQVLSDDIHSRWISVIKPISIGGGRLALGVPNDFYLLWLKENYLPLIRRIAAEELPGDADVVFEVSPDAVPACDAEKCPPPREAPAKSRPPSRPAPALNPSFTFDSFVVGPSNSLAHAACSAVAQRPAQAYNPLLVYGGSGLGKTHLMQAIGHQIFTASKTARVCYISAEAFLNEYIESIQDKSPTDFRRRYRGIDVLLLDDVHFLAGKRGIMEEFFHTFNALFNSRKQIVLTCDRPVSEIQGLEPRLVSRFAWGLVTELLPPDLETRVAILRKKAAHHNIQLSNEVILHVAENIRTDMRKLEGALTRIALFSSLSRQPLTLEAIDKLLRDSFEKAAPAPTTETIQRTVAECFDLRLSDLMSKRRPQSVVVPRQLAMYFCRSLTGQSLTTIGDAFGRNHATVIHACRSVEDRLRRDPVFRDTVESIRAKITA